MGTAGNWRLLLNERKGKSSRLIFMGYKHRSLIDITIESHEPQKVEGIIGAVLTSTWNPEQLIAFLDLESEKVYQEAL